MKYINQLEYSDITYKTNIKDMSSDFAKAGTISKAGCGICCLSMMVENLVEEALPLEECVEYAYRTQSNRNPGTDMDLLAPTIADQYGLSYRESNDIEDVVQAVKEGSYVIANTRGNYGDYKGLFSKGGHFILVVDADEDLLTVLDPSYRIGKYDHYQGEGTLLVNGHNVYCDQRFLAMDCVGKDPAYYVFSKKDKSMLQSA